MPIQILPARLANQIAAGEVVERPASVVKELVENSLDSGATAIEVEIEKGGHKRILIRDNGGGIAHDELALALSRHATSKISQLEDLETICSLGFRGEALASISSVARLSLSSKPHAQTQAWQAHCEGRDMQVQLNPVAHPDGTSVDVVDLFFNTPARRKFLKTEKTEFAHIDEVLRRIALSRFDVSFTLKHNGKLLKKYPAIKSTEQQIKRLTAICGKDAAENAIELNSQYQQLALKGWIVAPEQAGVKADFQYFYVNGRVMRDKLLNHAVRQAFEGLIGNDVYPSYVLYLTLETQHVDVNVHPAKHEVRFHQPRLVHDFIYRALTDALNQYVGTQTDYSPNPEVNILPQAEPKHDYIQPLQQVTAQQDIQETATERSYTVSHTGNIGTKRLAQYSVNSAEVVNQTAKNYRQLMTPPSENVDKSTHLNPTQGCYGQWLDLDNNTMLVKVEQQFYLVEKGMLHVDHMMQSFEKNMPISQPLLMPISIAANAELLAQAKLLYQPLLESSVEIGWTPNRVILRKVPAGLRQFRWVDAFEAVLDCISTNTLDVRKHLLTCIAKQRQWDNEQTQQLWQQWISQSSRTKNDLMHIGKLVSINERLNTNGE